MEKVNASFYIPDVPYEFQVLAESDKMFGVLNNEVNILWKILNKKPKSQPLRRTLIRSIFSFIEGCCFRLKQDALVFCDDFSPGEISLLKGKTYILNDRGIVKEKEAYLKAKANLRLAFKAYAKAFNADFELKVNSKGWESYLEALEIRNRITHPKKFLDLVIRNEDMEKVMEARIWFGENLTQLLKSTAESLAKQESEKAKNKP